MPRRASLALVALLLAPLAAAQAPETPLDPVQNPLRATAAGDVTGVRPLTGGGSTTVTVEVYCTALDPQAPTPVALSVESAPAWLTVTPSPETLEFPANAPEGTTPPCVNEWKAAEAFVFVAASAEAPANTPGQVVLLATMEDKTARAFFNASASAFTDIDVQPPADTTGAATPGEPWTFTVTIQNRGNAKVDVAIEGGAPRGVTVEVAGGQVGSRQAGDPGNEGTFDVKVTPSASAVDGTYPIWLNATATVPGAPTVRAARDSVQLQVQVTGATPPAGEEEESPDALLAAPLAFAAAAVAMRRRRS